MKCSIMLHFVWVFTVCLSTPLVVFSLQRVKPLSKLSQELLLCHVVVGKAFLCKKIGNLSPFWYDVVSIMKIVANQDFS